MSGTKMKIMAGLLTTGLAVQAAWAETIEHGPISVPPPVTATAPTETPSPAPQPPVAEASSPSVSRSAFTTAISGREPVDHLTSIAAGQQVFYFTEVSGLQGHVITHKWERDGNFELGLQFPIGGSPWRVYSSKTIPANLPGTWTVTVENDDGSVLKQESLVVDPVIPASAQPLTQIPAEIQKEPATRPEPVAAPPTATLPTDTETAATESIPAKPSPETSSEAGRPIWETLPR